MEDNELFLNNYVELLRDMTDNNLHTEAVVLLARLLLDIQDTEENRYYLKWAKWIAKQHKDFGYMPSPLYEFRFELQETILKELRQHLTNEQYNLLYGAL